MVETAPRELDGQSLVAKRISISEYIFERLLHEVLYGPLTEEDLWDQDDGEEVGSTSSSSPPIGTFIPMPNAGSLSPPKPSCSRKKLKAKLRSAYRRRMKRLALMARDTARIKGICKKRLAQATKDVIVVDFSMSTNSRVTKPGWVGKHNVDLLSRPLTLRELVKDYGLTHFPWDGM